MATRIFSLPGAMSKRPTSSQRSSPLSPCAHLLLGSISLAIFLATGCVSASRHREERDSELTLAPAIAAAGSAAASAAPKLNMDLNVNQLIQYIDGKVQKSANRPGFVRSMCNEFFYDLNGQYNIMLFNLNQDHVPDLKGVAFYRNIRYDGIPYGLWVFDSGTFTNKGDGGYINWCMFGSHERKGKDGKEVAFFKRR